MIWDGKNLKDVCMFCTSDKLNRRKFENVFTQCLSPQDFILPIKKF